MTRLHTSGLLRLKPRSHLTGKQVQLYKVREICISMSDPARHTRTSLHIQAEIRADFMKYSRDAEYVVYVCVDIHSYNQLQCEDHAS